MYTEFRPHVKSAVVVFRLEITLEIYDCVYYSQLFVQSKRRQTGCYFNRLSTLPRNDKSTEFILVLTNNLSIPCRIVIWCILIVTGRYICGLVQTIPEYNTLELTSEDCYFAFQPRFQGKFS